MRSDYNLPPAKPMQGTIVPAPGSLDRATYEAEAALVGRLARATVTIGDTIGPDAAAQVLLPGGATLAVPLAGLVDVDKECARLKGELGQLEKQLAALEGRLANPGFVDRAPPHVVDAERQKAADWGARRDQLREKVGTLCGG